MYGKKDELHKKLERNYLWIQAYTTCAVKSFEFYIPEGVKRIKNISILCDDQLETCLRVMSKASGVCTYTKQGKADGV